MPTCNWSVGVMHSDMTFAQDGMPLRSLIEHVQDTVVRCSVDWGVLVDAVEL
jgi:hypothetical protein